jgi:RNA polymerase sigma-70 factor (ECF subfamily)
MAIDVADETIKCVIGALDKRQVGVVDRLALERALGALSLGYRRIFLLHDVYGFGHLEIAPMDGCTEGTSKSQLHKARRSLRAALKSQTRRSR